MKELETIYQFILDNYFIDIKEDTRKREVIEMRDFTYLFCLKFIDVSERSLAEFVGRDRSNVNIKTRNFSESLPYNKALQQRYANFEYRCQEILKKSPREPKRSIELVKNHLNYHERMYKYFEKQFVSYQSKINAS